MRQRTRLVLNALINVLARVVTIASAFVVVPVALGALGRNHWGLWAIVGQIFAYTRILDMGLRSSVSRDVARGLARNEFALINSQVNTAGGYYMIAGIAVATLAAVVAFFFPTWYDVDPEYRTATRIMVLVSGFALAFSFVQNAYSAILSGLQRYDIVSGTNIIVDLLRLGLILAFIRALDAGGGLILLATVSGGTLLLGATIRTVAGLRLCRHVRFEPWKMDRSRLGKLFVFGINSVLYMMSIALGLQLALILVGVFIGSAEAADLNVASMIVLAAHALVVAFGISARVAASRYDGENNPKMLRLLLLRSTRYSGFCVVAGSVAIWAFSDALFRLWVGHRYQGPEETLALSTIGQTCRILLIGYGLFWLALPAYNVINGMGRHQAAAVMGMASALVSIVLVVILVTREGATITHVAWGIVLPMVPVCGLMIPRYCCKQAGQPIGEYVWEGLGIPLLGCLPAVVVGIAWNHYRPADSWAALIGQVATCAIVLLPPAWFAVLKRDDRSALIAFCKTKLGRPTSR